jgi:hypothetical protein
MLSISGPRMSLMIDCTEKAVKIVRLEGGGGLGERAARVRCRTSWVRMREGQGMLRVGGRACGPDSRSLKMLSTTASSADVVSRPAYVKCNVRTICDMHFRNI